MGTKPRPPRKPPAALPFRLPVSQRKSPGAPAPPLSGLLDFLNLVCSILFFKVEDAVAAISVASKM